MQQKQQVQFTRKLNKTSTNPWHKDKDLVSKKSARPVDTSRPTPFFKCPTCSERFTALCDIEKHIEETHKNSKFEEKEIQPVNLSVPPKTMPSFRIPTNMNSSNVTQIEAKNGLYFCPMCNNRYELKDELVSHMKDLHEFEEYNPNKEVKKKALIQGYVENFRNFFVN